MYRSKYGLPPLEARKPEDCRHHPYHIFNWDTRKLVCTNHEQPCAMCESVCCLHHEALRDLQGPTLAHIEAAHALITDLNSQTFNVHDVWPRMLRCSQCRNNICPDCAGRCKNGICATITCKNCAGPGKDPWERCACYTKTHRTKIP